MKNFIYSIIIRFFLAFRYRLRIVGLTKIVKAKKGGILFLANHTAEIDPLILLGILWKRFQPHPVAIDYLFRIPFLGKLLSLVKAFSVPYFDHGTNSYKKRKMELTYEKIFNALKEGENVLIYPSGGLKEQGEEVIGGASGVHTILQHLPEVNIVLIRVKGLWGSSFSKALTGKTPEIGKAFFKGFKTILKNLIFFVPKRPVLVTFEMAPADFPRQGSRSQINHALEAWYNQEGIEPLALIPYLFWKKKLPTQAFQVKKEERIDLAEVPQEITLKVKEEIGNLVQKKGSEIHERDHLAKDLGLDSLDIAGLVLFLREQFGVTSSPSDIHEVADVIAYAAKLKTHPNNGLDIENKLPRKWDEKRPLAFMPEGKSLQEAFLRASHKMRKYVAAADPLFGEVTYQKLLLMTLLLAEKLKEMPHEKIGIMLPSSITVNVLILSTLLAGKIPVMINWTLGKRNIEAVLQESGMEAALTSFSFLDKLEYFDFNGLDDKLLCIEDLMQKIDWKTKIRAFLLSYMPYSFHARYFELDSISLDARAVILFTSGTESLPKGVPLSHRNLLINQRDAYEKVSIQDNDVLLGILPPFHSFGFSVTGLFPLLSGLKVFYFPNPTDGKKIASLIEKWKVTLMCNVPTFLKNILRVATSEQMKTLRYVVTGAEKALPDIYERMHVLNEKTVVGEGYGITECSPILTINPFQKKCKGVGIPLSHVRLKIVHPETFVPLEVHKEGLILVQGESVFQGYLNPQLKSPFVLLGDEKWYNTGDLGYLDDEGYLILSGRLKRFVKIGGEMISLGAIEETLLKACAKRGWKVEQSDKPILGVVSKEEEGKKGEIHLFVTFALELQEANDALKEGGMSNLIKIAKVHQTPSIPLLGSGKIDYKSLV